MKEMLEKICQKQIFASLETIDPKILHSRKKISLFSAVDLKSFYHLVFSVKQKSRFVVKNVQEMIALEQKLVLHVGHQYKYKHILLCAPLCSKAAQLLVQSGWKVYQ